MWQYDCDLDQENTNAVVMRVSSTTIREAAGLVRLGTLYSQGFRQLLVQRTFLFSEVNFIFHIHVYLLGIFYEDE